MAKAATAAMASTSAADIGIPRGPVACSSTPCSVDREEAASIYSLAGGSSTCSVWRSSSTNIPARA